MADWRVAAELLEYYRRAANEAGALYPRQTIDPSSSTTTTTTSSSSSTSSTTSSSSTVSTVSTTLSSTSTSSSSSVSSLSNSSSSRSSSSSSSSSSEPASISSTITITIVTTDANGQSITTVSVTPTVIPNPQDRASSSNTNVGAIVGGIIGGIAFLLVLTGLVLWWRRKKRQDEFEAGIFDPDRNIQRPMSSTADPHFDLITTAAIPEAARSITPYSYGNQTGTGSGTAQGSSVGGQPEVQSARPPSSYYAYDNASAAGGTHYLPSAAGADAFPNPYDQRGYLPPSLIPGAAAAGFGAGGFEAANLNRNQTVSSATSSSYYPQSVYSNPTSYPQSHPSSPPFPQPNNQPTASVPVVAPPNPRAAKEREAFQRTRGNGWSVANQGPESPNGRTDAPVMVHQDGGRANIPEEDEDAREIPPTYDSIPRDDQGSSTSRPVASPSPAQADQAR